VNQQRTKNKTGRPRERPVSQGEGFSVLSLVPYVGGRNACNIPPDLLQDQLLICLNVTARILFPTMPELKCLPRQTILQ
jgi:hypothetical protein